MGIRLRFIGLLYAVIIGGSMQTLQPHQVDLMFVFSLFLLIVTLEDFFVYYTDVAPSNTEADGLSFFAMLTEVTILSTWFFAYLSFTAESWMFALYFAIFNGLKSLGGFINCAISREILTLKFARELVFLAAGALALWVFLEPPSSRPTEAPLHLAALAAVWLAQTVVWWLATAVVRRSEAAG